MWSDYKKLKNLQIAEMWKDLFEGEGLPAKIMRSKGEVQQIQQQKQAAETEQMQLQQAQQVAEAAGKVAPALKVANE